MMKINSVCNKLKTLGKVRILAGVSGGADSIALLLLLLRAGMDVQVIHFEHGIRGSDSVADADFVLNFCRERGVSCRVIPLDVPGRMRRGENLEAAARRMRLEEWHKLALEFPGCIIAIGHHRDDAIENFLLRFARGGNLSGLTNLRTKKELGGLRIIRPLLELSRLEIEKFLHAEGVDDFRTDSTNLEDSYQRNFLRNNVLKPWRNKFPAAESGWVRSLAALSLDADFLMENAEKLAEEVVEKTVTPLCFWRGLHPAMLPRVLNIYLNGDVRFTAGRLQKLTEFLQSDVSRGKFQFGTQWWIKERGQLILHDPATFGGGDAVEWNWRKEHEFYGFAGVFSAHIHSTPPEKFIRDPFHAWFNLEQLPESLAITTRTPGDAYTSFGGTHRKIKELFCDKKVGVLQKESQPLVKCGGTIIWIPGLDNSNFAPAVSGKPVVELIFRRDD